MGWNSWDSYGPTVREDEVKANADFISKNVAQYGWQYVIVDIEWYQPNAKAHGYIPGGAVTNTGDSCRPRIAFPLPRTELASKLSLIMCTARA